MPREKKRQLGLYFLICQASGLLAIAFRYDLLLLIAIALPMIFSTALAHKGESATDKIFIPILFVLACFAGYGVLFGLLLAGS